MAAQSSTSPWTTVPGSASTPTVRTSPPTGRPDSSCGPTTSDATLHHLRRLDVRITSDVEDAGSVRFVQFEDPDGNPLMVCQRSS